MRILDKDSAGVDFDVLGLTGESDRILRDALAEPNGIILVTGPTGSGKRSEEHTSELQSLMRISYAVFCLKKKKKRKKQKMKAKQVNSKMQNNINTEKQKIKKNKETSLYN